MLQGMNVSSVTVFAVLLFALVTLYLVFSGNSWEHYDTFAGIAGGGGLLGQVGNKFINSKWNNATLNRLLATEGRDRDEK